MQSDFDNNLLDYFTDVEHLRGIFKDFVMASSLPKHLIAIHGVGGAGKSSLLRMFLIHCKSERIPVALASGDDAKSVFDVITRWVDDLEVDGVKFSSISKTMETYRAIQAKVGEQAKKNQSTSSRMADIASKAASKTAETAGGALLGAAIGSVIPGIGTAIGGALGGVVSGMGADALTDWLRSFLTKPDIDLLLDPEKRLTTDFLADMAKAAEKKRIVLLLDTYEQMTALEDWVGEIGQKIHPNILIVVAGRILPDWNRSWQGWMANAQVEELKPMTEDIMRELIRRYYATMHGGEPDSAQVEAIIRFARGLPMAVTSAVQLWVKYDVEDFQSVKAEIVANLVDRLMEGVPSALIPALEAAAVVRWFDQPILRAVTGREDVRDVYNELRRFPFVRTRVEGLALHDTVREMMDENLRVQDSERHSELHERAAIYFEKRLEKANADDIEKLGFERLYHRIRSNEESGIVLFQEIAEGLTRYRLVNRLRILLNDVNTYSLEREKSKLWLKYYNARLLYLLDYRQNYRIEAERVYQEIVESSSADLILRAHALHDWGMIQRERRIMIPAVVDKAISCFEESLKIAPLDNKLALSLLELSPIYRDKGQWDKALNYLNEALNYYKEHNSFYDLAIIYLRFGWHYTYRGDWLQAYNARTQCLSMIQKAGNPPFLKMVTSSWMTWFYTGRWHETEDGLQKDYQTGVELGVRSEVETRDSARVASFCEKFDVAEQHFSKDLEKSQELSKYTPRDKAIALGFYGISCVRKGEISKAIDLLNESLSIKKEIQDTSYLLETLNWLGICHEILGQFSNAEKVYRENLKEYRWAGRLYFDCGALTGLARVKHAQGETAVIPPLLAEAERLAQQYEYNDYLASLQLTQSYLAWEAGNINQALLNCQHAMIFALRFNRFLLDELISGRSQGTPLRPIIPYCLERGEKGKNILIALRDWWKTGVNDIGIPRSDTISPIPQGILLSEAEKIAREREPGNGSLQKGVVEQLEAVL